MEARLYCLGQSGTILLFRDEPVDEEEKMIPSLEFGNGKGGEVKDFISFPDSIIPILDEFFHSQSLLFTFPERNPTEDQDLFTVVLP